MTKNKSKLFLLLNFLFVIFLAALILPKHVFATACTAFPLIGNQTFTNCTETVSTLTGLDDAGGSETSTTNNAVLTLSGTTAITIANGGTLIAKSISLPAGKTASIAIQAGGTIELKKPIYITDADVDGYPGNLTTFHDATNSGTYRRLSLMKSLAGIDCNDGSALVFLPHAVCNVDSDSDSFTAATAMTCLNTTSCNTATKASITSNGAGVTTYTAGQLLNTASALYDYCDNEAHSNNICNTGTGLDSTLTVSGTHNIDTEVLGSVRSTYADAIPYQVQTMGANYVTVNDPSAAGLVKGDEVVLINEQGDATNFDSVGNYEFLEVLSVTPATSTNVTFGSNIVNTYGVGGNADLTNQDIRIQRVPNYTTVSVPGGATLGAAARNETAATGGNLFLRATGAVTVGGSINLKGVGYIGLAGTTSFGKGGESYCGSGGLTAGAAGAGGAGAAQNGGIGGAGKCGGGGGGGGVGHAGGAGSTTHGGSGGGGAAGTNAGSASGGGGGGYGTAGLLGTGCCGTSAVSGSLNKSGNGGGSDGSANGGPGGGGGYGYGTATLTTLFLGSAGGAGGGIPNQSYSGGTGGNGGGIIFISSNSISVTGTITADGNGGGNASNATHPGSGGGGAGGSIRLYGVGSVSIGTTLVTAAKGLGGTTSQNGGNGGDGIIAIHGTVTGTTTPTYTAY